MKPIFVNSIPKSGTYLLAAILEEMGFSFTQWHVFGDFCDDYSRLPMSEARSHPERCRIRRPIERTIASLLPGQVAVGHVPFTERTRSALQGCFVILLGRDLRECLVSHMNWQLRTGRDQRGWTRVAGKQERFLEYLRIVGRGFVAQAQKIAAWHATADCVLMKDDLVKSATISQLANRLHCVPDPCAVSRALNRVTLTRVSPAPWREYWSEDAERWFAAHAEEVACLS